MKHITKDGRVIDVKDMTFGHLYNTIASKVKAAREGIEDTFRYTDQNGDEAVYSETITGERALEYLGVSLYVKEIKERMAQGRGPKVKLPVEVQ